MKTLGKAISLFDGIGCLWQALKQLGISVDQAYSYEINKYAIQICAKNHPEVTHMGSVVGADFSQHKGADLVAGGFPCTDLSISKKDRKGLQGEHSSLFWELVRAIKEIQPRYFLVENNDRIPRADRDIITKTLGVEPIMINSALVSAQSRKRLYWTNIASVQPPEDRGILLADIIESGATWREKAVTLDASYYKGGNSNLNSQSGRRLLVGEPICDRVKSLCVTTSPLGNIEDYLKKRNRQAVFTPLRILTFGKGHQNERVYSVNAKRITLSTGNNAFIMHPACVNSKSGRGGNPTAQPSVQDRIYSVNGKMVAVTTGHHPSVAIKAKNGYNGRVVTVKNGITRFNGGKYKLNLPDGDYLIRKLTPVECERLQTLPDDYTAGISNTQRYKCLGNGWTIEVIRHILSSLV